MNNPRIYDLAGLGERVLAILRAAGPDMMDRLNDITMAAIDFGLGVENAAASEDTDPWLVDRVDADMTKEMDG